MTLLSEARTEANIRYNLKHVSAAAHQPILIEVEVIHPVRPVNTVYVTEILGFEGAGMINQSAFEIDEKRLQFSWRKIASKKLIQLDPLQA